MRLHQDEEKCSDFWYIWISKWNRMLSKSIQFDADDLKHWFWSDQWQMEQMIMIQCRQAVSQSVSQCLSLPLSLSDSLFLSLPEWKSQTFKYICTLLHICLFLKVLVWLLLAYPSWKFFLKKEHAFISRIKTDCVHSLTQQSTALAAPQLCGFKEISSFIYNNFVLFFSTVHPATAEISQTHLKKTALLCKSSQ